MGASAATENNMLKTGDGMGLIGTCPKLNKGRIINPLQMLTVSLTSGASLYLLTGMAMAAMKLNARGAENRHISSALASNEYAFVYPGISR